MGMWSFIIGQDYHLRAQRDQWRPMTIGKNLISPVNDYGTCFCCDGEGMRTLKCRVCGGSGSHKYYCRVCQGSGEFVRSALTCFGCQGAGIRRGKACQRCNGTGEFKTPLREACRRCSGSGRFAVVCSRCDGKGSFTLTCRKCSGSGWHRFS